MGYRITVNNPFTRGPRLNAASGVWEWTVNDATFNIIVPPDPWSIEETGTTYSTLPAAIAAASAGQTIVGVPGTYYYYGLGLYKNLSIKSSVPGQKIVIDASGLSTSGGGGIIQIAGASINLTDIHVFGNKYAWNFNPGIGTYGPSGTINLTRCLVEECSNGFMGGSSDDTSIITMIDCEFRNNGDYDGYQHQIYASHHQSLTMRGCWVHNTKMRDEYNAEYGPGNSWRESWGHLVKARTKVLVIEGCRLTMEKYSSIGGANRCIDYSNGGDLTVRGNLIEYRTTQNGGTGQAIAWGIEGANTISGSTWDRSVWKVNIQQNTIVGRSVTGNPEVNKYAMWIGVGIGGAANPSVVPAPSEYIVKDNVFVGWLDTPPRVREGSSNLNSTTYGISTTDNTVGATSLLIDAANYNYQLVTPVVGSQNWTPYMYQHPTSTIARGDANRGASYSGFATGSDTGSIVGNVWTPARTGGVVNQASWNIVPTGEWVQIANSDMGQMNPEILTVDPSWTGKLDWRGGVANNYSGMTIDTPNARFWYVAAGGHTGGFGNNGIYRFDMYKASWTIEQMPSVRSLWSSTYANTGSNGGTYTGCGESLVEETTQRTAGTWSAANEAGNAWGMDEIYWDNPAIAGGAGVGRPTARHTYYAVSYNPLTEELYIGSGTPGVYTTGRRLWCYSRTLGYWTWKRSLPFAADGAVNGHILDPVNNVIYMWGAGDGVNTRYKIDLNTFVSSIDGWFPLYGRDAATVTIGRTVTGVEKQLRDYSTRNNYFTKNLDTGSTVTSTWQYGEGLSISDFPYSSAAEGQSIAYIPSLNRYWLVSYGLWYQLDPTTTPWTATKLTFTSSPPPFPVIEAQLYQKMFYSEAINAVVCQLDGSANVYIYKF